MCKIIYRSLSIILVLTLVVQLLPLSCFAADAAESGEPISEATTPEAEPLVPSEGPMEEEPTEEEKETPPPQIVEEDLRKRDEYYKEFLLDNGQRLATVYPTAVHYQKDGQWEEIDNTLTLTGTAYTNTAGPWSVQFPQRLSGSNAISITKDGFTVSFSMSGELTSGGGLAVASIDATATAELSVATVKTSMAQIQSVDTTSLKASAQFPETVPDKLHGRLMYPAVYDNTNVVYDLDGTRLKESIILPAYDAALYGYRYTLNTGGLTATLNADQSISLCDPETGAVILSMPAPFLIDDNGEYSYDVQVALTETGSGYLLSYYLPNTWLAAENRAWPVVLDPIVSASVNDNIEDIAVTENYVRANTATVLECGYATNWGIMRSYMRFTSLPQLSSADVIVSATLQMTVCEGGGTTNIEVHKVSSTWSLDSIAWDNQPSYNSIIEDVVSTSSTALNKYTWDVTDIARVWYANASYILSNNTGMLFKATDSIESGGTNNWKQFYSGNSSSNKPYLTIQYQNASGLEDYWDYTTSSAGRAGTGYVQNFSGNLVWVHEDMGFDGNRMPVSIQHIYNASDATAGKNDFGLGIGWRTNYHQSVTANQDTYDWVDGDGTVHSFLPTDDSAVYADADGLNLQLHVYDASYTITDDYGNTSYFDSYGRLTKMANNQAVKSSINITYSGRSWRITQITDGIGRKYTFVYSSSSPVLLTQIAYYSTGSTVLYDVDFGYSSSKLTTITYQDGETTTYSYGSNSLLYGAANIDGYQIRYTYQIVQTGGPARINTIREYDGTTYWNRLTLNYTYLHTKITDHDGRYQNIYFNIYGDTTSISDDEGKGQFWKYSTTHRHHILEESQEQSTTTNLLSDISFERGTNWTLLKPELSNTFINSDSAYVLMGSKSLAVSVGSPADSLTGAYSPSFTISAGKTVTFSAYVLCTNGSMRLEIHDDLNKITAGTSTARADVDNSWVRLEVTYTNTSTSSRTIRVGANSNQPSSYGYLDGVQLEYAESASRFNLVENGDFTYSASDKICWTSESSFRIDHTGSYPILDLGQITCIGDNGSVPYVEQTIKISGDGDKYVVGGWAYGNCSDVSSTLSNYHIVVYFKYGTNTVSSSTLYFSKDNTGSDWQFVAGSASAGGLYDSIVVRLVNYNNLNSVSFDGIQLYQERLGTSYTYTDEGYVNTSTDILGMKTTYEYSSSHPDPIRIIPAVGPAFEYEYDAYHNPTKCVEYTPATESDARKDITTTTYTYDGAYGNLSQTKITNGSITQTTSTAYTTNGNQISSTTSAEGITTAYSYNADTGLLEWVQAPRDSESTRTVYEYDSMYRLTRVSEGLVTSTTTEMQVMYTYTDDELTEIQNNFNSYYLSYIDSGELSSVRVGNSENNRLLVEYQYSTDEDHRLIELDYGNGFGIQYSYDDKDRLTVKTYTTDSGNLVTGTVTYTYNKRGDLASVKDSVSGLSIKYEYDNYGRLTHYSETGDDRSLHSVTYSYDASGNLSQRRETIGSETRVTNYTYNDDDLVSQTVTGDVKTVFNYDDLDRVYIRQTHYQNTALVYRDITYSANSNQVQTIRNHAYSGDYDVTYTYTYDANGNIRTVSDGTYTTRYVYDGANQLVREDNERAGKTWYWNYLTDGNLRNVSEFDYTLGAPVDATSKIEYSYTLSTWHNLLTKYGSTAFTYDTIGNTLTDGAWTYTWERGRQLQSMTNGTTTWNMTYDADGLRTSRIATDSEGNTGSKYYYYYENGLLTYMKFNSLVMRFTYDAQGNPVSMTYNGNIYFYVLNLQGDVMALLDANGNEVVSYHYNAWGEIISTTASTTAMLNTLAKYNPLRYRGYVYDRETGLYYLQSRYYNPELGRFINADDVDLLAATGTPLSCNLFAYCNNNPVMCSDENGYWGHIFLGALVGAIVGAAEELVSQTIRYVTTGEEFDMADVVISAAAGATFGCVITATGSTTMASMAATAMESYGTGIKNGDSVGEIVADALVSTAFSGMTASIPKTINKSLSGKYLKLNKVESIAKKLTDPKIAGGLNHFGASVTSIVKRSGIDLVKDAGGIGFQKYVSPLF